MRYHTHLEAIVRTNIVIDDKLMEKAKKTTGLPTKKAVVEEALRVLIRTKQQEKILGLRGKIRWGVIS
jgi:Arc/MetJ family transcription regulator